MDYRPRGGFHINRGDPFVFGEPKRYRDIPVDVRSICWNVISRRHLNDQVRLTEHPAGSEFRRRGRVRRVPFRHPLLHPFLDQCDVAVAQPPVVSERIRCDLGLPRRHIPGLRNRGDNFSLLRHVLIRQERKRSRFTRTVTGSAVLVNNRGYLLVESDRLGSAQSRSRTRKQSDSRGCQKTKASAPRMLRGVLTSRTGSPPAVVSGR